jgi:radical SAM protein with 4Fe4S-binding SPASM domain
MLKKNGVDYIQISLESAIKKENDLLRGKNSFDKVVNAIYNLKNAGFLKNNIYITATITKENIKGLVLFEEFASKMGVSYSYSLFQPVRDNKTNKLLMSSCKELFLLYVEIAERYGGLKKVDVQKSFDGKISDDLIPSIKTHCGVGASTIGIKEDGGVVPCHLFFSSDSFVMGNILDKDILKKMGNFLRNIPSIDEIDECKDCNIRYFCGNGCRAGNLFFSKSFYKRTPYCEFFYKYYSPIIWNIGENNETIKIYEIFENTRKQYI